MRAPEPVCRKTLILTEFLLIRPGFARYALDPANACAFAASSRRSLAAARAVLRPPA